MILIPLLALIVGFALGAVLAVDIPPASAPYVAVAVLAGLDSVFGGSRSILEGKFQTEIFLTGFLMNILAALFLVWLGEGIGITLVTVAAIVFGIRIFTNLSLIRRIILSRLTQKRDKRSVSESSVGQSSSA